VSDLDRAVDARIDSFRPAQAPPFDAIVRRKRARERSRRTAAAVLLAVAAAVAVAAAPSFGQSAGQDRLAGTGGPPSAGGSAGPARPGPAPEWSRSCGPTAADAPSLANYLDIVRWDGADYVAYGPADGAVLERQIGVVRCKVSGSLTPVPYQFQDGDAAHLAEGTGLYEVQGRRAAEAIAAERAGRLYLFTRVPLPGAAAPTPGTGPACRPGDYDLVVEQEGAGGAAVISAWARLRAGRAPCRLRGSLTLTLLDAASNKPLSVAGNPSTTQVDQDVAAVQTATAPGWVWRNWCGGPGHRLAVTFGDASSRAEADAIRPRCDAPQDPSAVSAVSAAPGDAVQLRLLASADADWTDPDSYAVVDRRISGSDALSRARSLLAVLGAGPTDAERSRGLAPTGWPADTSVYRLDLDAGRLIVDFDEQYAQRSMNGDSGGSAELSALLANVFQIDGVDSVELRVAGSCEMLHKYVGDGSPDSGCVTRTKAQAEEWHGA
jgi:hypothetical protein